MLGGVLAPQFVAALGEVCTSPGYPDNCGIGAVCGQNRTCVAYTGTTGGNTSGTGAGGLNTAALQTWTDSVIAFINGGLVPLLTAIAFIVFLWGVYKYFILGGADEGSRAEGRMYVLYGVIGFVVIFALWGLVYIGVDFFNLRTGGRPGTLPYPAL